MLEGYVYIQSEVFPFFFTFSLVDLITIPLFLVFMIA